MEWLEKLPLVDIANSIVILVVGLAAGLGFRSGKRSPAAGQSRTGIEVATDFFDSQAIKFLTTEVTGQAIAITAQAGAIREQTMAIRELSALGERWIEMHEDEERRRIEREQAKLEREVDELRRRERDRSIETMRRD